VSAGRQPTLIQINGSSKSGCFKCCKGTSRLCGAEAYRDACTAPISALSLIHGLALQKRDCQETAELPRVRRPAFWIRVSTLAIGWLRKVNRHHWSNSATKLESYSLLAFPLFTALLASMRGRKWLFIPRQYLVQYSHSALRFIAPFLVSPTETCTLRRSRLLLAVKYRFATLACQI
jgi:hypothetical protein